ncbi:MAG: hypothetical protein ACO4AU_02945 [bacterium]|jgi:hypothetical protein
MEEFLIQLKSNRFVRYATLGGLVVLGYVFGGVLTAIFTLVGVALGRMSYNDHVEDVDL